MLTKHTALEVKADESRYVVEAYASTRDRDLVGDVVAEGAFRKSLVERAGQIAALWQHNPETPVGRPIELREDGKGLYTVTQFNRDTTWGRDAFAAVRNGDVTGVSIGFDLVGGKTSFQTDNGKSTRVLHEVKLYEYSFVTFPAQEAARVMGAKSMDEVGALLVALEEALGKGLSADERDKVRNALSVMMDSMALEEPDDASTPEPPSDEPDPESVKVLQSLVSEMRSELIRREISRWTH